MATLTVSEESRYTVQSAVKVLEVLFAFQGADGPLAVPEVAVRLGMNRNQVYRCFKTLESVGLVRDGPRGFTLTPRLLDLVPAMDEESILAVAGPLCARLRDETEETVNLVVPVGPYETMLLATYPTRRGIGLMSHVGDRSYMHAGAVPKAILAFRPPEDVERFLAVMPHAPRYTERTSVDPSRLREELAEIRARGYSVSDEDYEDGARGVGVPVFGPDGAPMAGISVGGPTHRVTDATLARLAEVALTTAAAISQRLGYRPGRAAAGSSADGSPTRPVQHGPSQEKRGAELP